MTSPQHSINTGTRSWRSYRDLFLVSFLILFFELACIRWFGSTVVHLTFFTNIVLLATFLGMSIGCLSASRGQDWTEKVLPLLFVAVIAACGVLWIFTHTGRLMVDVGGQGSPQQVYFGTEFQARDPSTFVVGTQLEAWSIPIELLALLFFYLITYTFVGLGQVLGRAFDEARDRLRAYISNIIGSLAGIAVFALASYLWTSPMAWFAIVMALWLYFLKRRTLRQLYCGLAVLLLLSFVSYNTTVRSPYQTSETGQRSLIWSPYY